MEGLILGIVAGVTFTFVGRMLYEALREFVKEKIKEESFEQNKYKRCRNCKYYSMTKNIGSGHCVAHDLKVLHISWCEDWKDARGEK